MFPIPPSMDAAAKAFLASGKSEVRVMRWRLSRCDSVVERLFMWVELVALRRVAASSGALVCPKTSVCRTPWCPLDAGGLSQRDKRYQRPAKNGVETPLRSQCSLCGNGCYADANH